MANFSTTYTGGPTAVSYSGWGTTFVQAPLSYSTGTLGAATVGSFDVHLSSQSGSDVLAILNRSVTVEGNSESVTTLGNDVYVNNTLYGSYTFSGQDLVFTFSSANSNPAVLGAIMEAVSYQNTSFRTAGTEVVS
jgi:hypothetical protein